VLAEEFSHGETFRLDEPFDKIFISYSLLMFPKWREALLNSLENLKPGGDLYIVDFWNGNGQFVLFNRLLRWWLGLFKVRYRPEFLEFLKELKKEGIGKYTVTPVGQSYAFIAHFQTSVKSDDF